MDASFKNVGKSSAAKNYLSVSLLSVVSKVFQKLVNNVDHLQNCGLISSMVLGLLDQTADLLTVVTYRIARIFNGCGTTVAVNSKTFDRVWHGGFFANLSLTEFQVRYLVLFILFAVIDGFGWFWIGSLHKNIE